MTSQTNVLALKKDSGQKYIFMYDDESEGAVLRSLGTLAADKELDFSWYDAATLAKRLGKQKAEREGRT